MKYHPNILERLIIMDQLHLNEVSSVEVPGSCHECGHTFFGCIFKRGSYGCLVRLYERKGSK